MRNNRRRCTTRDDSALPSEKLKVNRLPRSTSFGRPPMNVFYCSDRNFRTPTCPRSNLAPENRDYGNLQGTRPYASLCVSSIWTATTRRISPSRRRLQGRLLLTPRALRILGHIVLVRRVENPSCPQAITSIPSASIPARTGIAKCSPSSVRLPVLASNATYGK